MNKKNRNIVFLVIWFLICNLAILGCSYFIPYHLDSFKGKVIDADTKKPIEGAVILAVYHQGSLSFAGSDYYPVEAQETLTDDKGEFTISSKTVWFRKDAGSLRGKLVIFEPGYGALWHKRAKAVGENKTWPLSKKYIVYELPKLSSKKERVDNLPIKLYDDISFEKRQYFMKAVNQERKELGFRPYPIPKILP